MKQRNVPTLNLEKNLSAMLMNNTAEWYQTVHLYCCVPPQCSTLEGSGKPECYALSVRNAQLPNLKIDVPYRFHAYFYHKRQRYFFGKPFCSEWYRSVANCVLFNEVAFFWCSLYDDIDVVLELVEGEQVGRNSNLYTAAWTSSPLGSMGNPVADYSSSNHQLLFKRLPLYAGSPKELFFMGAGMETAGFSRKAHGSLEICLQTHQKMYTVLRFIPEWHIFGKKDEIPGLQTFSDGKLQLADPEPLKGHGCILKQLKVSFGTDADKFEQILLHLMNNDRLYRANRSPADINVKPMEVLERRITIGVHNGLRYVEGPQCLLLSSSENQIYGTLDIRRNYKLMSRSSTNLTLQFQSLYVNGSVILNRMIADPRFAIVFSLDYLVGVYSYDGTIYSSQSVMVCWGAWCPFAANSRSDSQITVPLIGGPNINPDGRLGFKNMLAFRYDLPLGDQLPRINITFSYSELNGIKLPKDTSRRIDNASQREDVRSTEVEAIRLQSKSIPATRKPKTMRKTRLGAESSPLISPGGEQPEEIPFDEHQRIDAVSNMPIFSLPIMRISNAPRASLAVLNDVSFSPIKDRNGNTPKFVDIEHFRAPDINIELNDQLNTNETVVQFMAVAFSLQENTFIKIPSAVFFTMQFYRFQTVTTERLVLNPVHAKNGHREQLYILKRGEVATEGCNGFTVKYTIDRNSLLDGEEDDYLNYLLSGCLIVDLWDADSLLPLGTSYIPLKYLLRHGSEAVQADIQSAMVLCSVPEPPTITCQLLLRLVNIGHPSTKEIDITRSRTSAIISHRLSRTGQEEIASYRIRAKPLNPIHKNALQRFLAAQRTDINQRYNEVTNGISMNIKNRESMNKLLTTKGSVKRYLFQQELEAYKKLRNEDKASKLLKAVFKAITTEHWIYPKFGQIVFFEFLLQNTEPEATVIVVDTAQSTLRPLLDEKIWKYYKDVYKIETPLERDLYQMSEENGQTGEVYICLKPMETIYAPFIYDGFALPHEQTRNQVKAVFKKKNSGEPIAILDLLIESRHVIVSNSFRFYHAAESTLTRIIRIAGWKDKGRVLALRCTDPLALLSLTNNPDGSQDLQFTYQTGKAPTLRTFTVVLFADKYYDTVLEAWLIHIHAVNQINWNAVRAQLTKIPIILKIDNDDCMVQLSSLSRDLEIHPSGLVTAQRGTILDAVAIFTPHFTGMTTMLISAINQRTKRLLNQWMIVANVQEANITKLFEVYLENNRIQTIKLTVGNRYGVERSFRISCSHPQYVQIYDDIVVLPGYKVADVCVTFLPSKEPKLSEVLIFVTNVENNLQEEAYSLKLIYRD